MKSTIFLFLCWTLMSSFADKPTSWYPDNSDEISKKCYEDNKLPEDLRKNLENNQLFDDPKVYDVLLCQAKAINAYSEEAGLDVLRLAESYYRDTKKPKCRKFLVQDCADQHESVVSPGEKLYKVIQCLNEMEDENTKRLESLR